ncbi:MAG: hypothetical protein ACRDQA_32385 [Nocardioidaceae bacterium]
MDDDSDIPPLLPPDQQPPIRTQEDLYQHWRALMGPLGFSERLLWLCFVNPDGVVAPTVSQIAEIPVMPQDEEARSLIHMVAEVLEREAPGGSVAILLSRPGRPEMTGSDRAWARALTSAAAVTGVRMQPVHLANDHEVRVFAPDDLEQARTA